MAGPAVKRRGRRSHYRELLRQTLGRQLVLYFLPLLALAAYFNLQYWRFTDDSRRSHLSVMAEQQANTLDLFLRERLVNLSNLIDDESRFLKTIAQRLRLRGLDVSTATNGPDAIALAREQPFDVALLDLKLPGMDGSQVLGALKQLDPLLEAIILTGHGSLRSAVELSQMGAFSYLPKPYELEQLLDTLTRAYARRLCNRPGASRQAAQLDAAEAITDPLARLKQLGQLGS